MKLRELKECIDKCWEKIDETDPDVEFILETDITSEYLEVEEIGQFGVIPDVTITLKGTGNYLLG